MLKKHIDNGPCEDAIQMTVMQWIYMQPMLHPYIFHIPNGGDRSPQYASKLRKMGLKPGVSDLFIAMPKKGYHGMWLELKAKTGRLGPAQKVFLADMEAQGYLTKVCFSIEEAILTIQEYCFD